MAEKVWNEEEALTVLLKRASVFYGEELSGEPAETCAEALIRELSAWCNLSPEEIPDGALDPAAEELARRLKRRREKDAPVRSIRAGSFSVRYGEAEEWKKRLLPWRKAGF